MQKEKNSKCGKKQKIKFCDPCTWKFPKLRKKHPDMFEEVLETRCLPPVSQVQGIFHGSKRLINHRTRSAVIHQCL